MSRTPGADVSATETIANEWADSTASPGSGPSTRPSPQPHSDRYDNLITNRSDLSDEQADLVRGPASYGALVAALRDAESRGLDITTALPQLVQARTLIDTGDAAAVLHERVDRWMRAAPVMRAVVPDRIVGLFPKLDAATDPDMQLALQERQSLIEHRTRELSEQAVRVHQPRQSPGSPTPVVP